MCSGKDLLDLENEDSVVFYLLSEQRSAPFPSCYCLHLVVSVHIGQPLGSQSGAYLSSASFPASVGGRLYALMCINFLRTGSVVLIISSVFHGAPNS